MNLSCIVIHLGIKAKSGISVTGDSRLRERPARLGNFK